MAQFKCSELQAFVASSLVAAGADSVEAEQKAALLVWCDQIGRDTQGVWRLPMICQRLREGVQQSPVTFEFERVSTSQGRLDGGAGLGYLVASRAMQESVSLAKESGIGCVAVRNASHLGAAALYVKQAADEGLIGLCFSNSVPKVAAIPGGKALWGTNPLAIGIPRNNGKHILVDMATAASAGSTLTRAAELGNAAAPESLATSQGEESCDPAVLQQGGTVLPMAGAKGFALGMVVEIFSALLTGAAMTSELRSMHHDFSGPAGNGHLMVAIDIAPLMPVDIFNQRLEALLEQVYASAPMGEIKIPGEVRWDSYERSLIEGVHVASDLVAKLQALAEELGVEFPAAISAVN